MVEFRYFNHCGYCAGKLVKKTDTVYDCQKCGKPTFNNPSIGAGILVFDGDKCLISIRAIEPGKGNYDMVGGFVDFGESPQDAARREFTEETCGKIIDLEVGHIFTSDYTENITVVDIVFFATIDPDIELVPNDDVAELLWVDVNDLNDEQFGYGGATNAIRISHAKYKAGLLDK